MRVDNENVRGAKNCLETDLGELAAKRKEIEALQATLYQLLSQKSSGKVDVKELKAQLAENVRHTRLQKPAGVFRSKRGRLRQWKMRRGQCHGAPDRSEGRARGKRCRTGSRI